MDGDTMLLLVRASLVIGAVGILITAWGLFTNSDYSENRITLGGIILELLFGAWLAYFIVMALIVLWTQGSLQ